MDYLYFVIGAGFFILGIIVAKVIQKIRSNKADGSIIVVNDEDGPLLFLQIPDKAVLKKKKIILDISQKNQRF